MPAPLPAGLLPLTAPPIHYGVSRRAYAPEKPAFVARNQSFAHCGPNGHCPYRNQPRRWITHTARWFAQEHSNEWKHLAIVVPDTGECPNHEQSQLQRTTQPLIGADPHLRGATTAHAANMLLVNHGQYQCRQHRSCGLPSLGTHARTDSKARTHARTIIAAHNAAVEPVTCPEVEQHVLTWIESDHLHKQLNGIPSNAAELTKISFKSVLASVTKETLLQLL